MYTYRADARLGYYPCEFFFPPARTQKANKQTKKVDDDNCHGSQIARLPSRVVLFCLLVRSHLPGV